MTEGLRMNLIGAISAAEYLKAIDALDHNDYSASNLSESFRKISLCLNGSDIEKEPIFKAFLENEGLKTFPSGNERLEPGLYIRALSMREDLLRSNNLLTQKKIKDIEEEDRSIFEEAGVRI